MIKIQLYKDKWRLQIGNDEGEKWEFNTSQECLICLKELMEFKEKYGKLKQEGRYDE